MPMLKTPERSAAEFADRRQPDRHAEPYSRGKNAGNEQQIDIRLPPFGQAAPSAVRYREDDRSFDDPNQRKGQRQFALQRACASEKDSEQARRERYRDRFETGDQCNRDARKSEPLAHTFDDPLIYSAGLDGAGEAGEPAGNRHYHDGERLHPEAGIGGGAGIGAEHRRLEAEHGLPLHDGECDHHDERNDQSGMKPRARHDHRQHAIRRMA